jgi:UDP-N-acetyl-D-mannosaminuronate dehydrogenase
MSSRIEIAELLKMVENSYRFVEIAFAEELKMMCDELGVAYEELRQAVNTKWSIKLLEARDGIGGHCLPKDTQMYLNVGTNALNLSIVEAAKIMDQYYKHVHVPKLTRKEMTPSKYINVVT